MKKLFTILALILVHTGYAQLVQNSTINNLIKQSFPENQLNNAKVQATELRLMGLMEEDFDGVVFNYLDSARFVYDSDAGMQILDLLSPAFNEAFVVLHDGFIWVPYARIENIFDAEGQRITLEISYWDGAIYEAYARYHYTYDEDGNVTEIITEFFDGVEFVYSSRNFYTYTLAGVLDYFIIDYWNGVDWEPNARYIYTYLPEGLVSIILHQEHDGVDFVDDYRQVYLYNLDNKVTSITYQEFDGVDTFEDDNRTIFEYDGMGYLTLQTDQNHDGVDWENYMKIEYLNNAEGLSDQYFYSYWDGAVWEMSLRVTNTYESYETTNIISINPEAEIIIFPNPANEEITVQFPTIRSKRMNIRVIDNSGKVISSEIPSNIHHHTINLNALKLTTGIYYIELFDGEKRYVKSFEKL